MFVFTAMELQPTALKVISVKNGLKLSVTETTYACVTLFSKSSSVLSELCFKKYILKCD